MLLVTEIIFNIIDDAIVLARSGYGIFVHWDIYNFSVICGKIAKIVLQLYLDGAIFKSVYYSYDN